ncbi:hypothetical protein SFUMM280S_02450 [Streptomyces fumanus]
MAALARWCVQRRLVTVLLWLLALAGTTAGAAALGSAYSNDYGVPGTESDRAARLLDAGSPAAAATATSSSGTPAPTPGPYAPPPSNRP